MKKYYLELDSLRGLAALSVLIGHFLLIYTFAEPNTYGQVEYSTWNIFKYSPLHIFWAGHEAVILFFLLSGFVLSLPFYKNDFSISGQWYKGYLIKRICRIYLPYAASTLVAIAFIILLRPNTIAGASDFVNRIWASDLTLENLLGHVLLIGSFDTSAINPVIWSLSHEMRISILFPFLIYFVKKLKLRNTIILAFGLSIFSYILLQIAPPQRAVSLLNTPHYAAMFVVGALLAKHIEEIVSFVKGANRFYKTGVVLIAILAYTYNWIFYDVQILHIYLINEWAVVVGASLFIVIALSLKPISNFLVLKPIHYLGKISYSLYLYHLISLMVVIHYLDNYDAKGLILISGFILSFILAILSYHFIEKPSIKLGRQLSNYNDRASKIPSVKQDSKTV